MFVFSVTKCRLSEKTSWKVCKNFPQRIQISFHLLVIYFIFLSWRCTFLGGVFAAFKSKMSLVVSVHVYSVQKAVLRDSGPLYSVDYDAVKDNLKNCNRHADLCRPWRVCVLVSCWADEVLPLCRYSAIRCAGAVPTSSVELQQQAREKELTFVPENKKPAMNGDAASKAPSKPPKGIMGMFSNKPASKHQVGSKDVKPELKEEAPAVRFLCLSVKIQTVSSCFIVLFWFLDGSSKKQTGCKGQSDGQVVWESDKWVELIKVNDRRAKANLLRWSPVWTFCLFLLWSFSLLQKNLTNPRRSRSLSRPSQLSRSRIPHQNLQPCRSRATPRVNPGGVCLKPAVNQIFPNNRKLMVNFIIYPWIKANQSELKRPTVRRRRKGRRKRDDGSKDQNLTAAMKMVSCFFYDRYFYLIWKLLSFFLFVSVIPDSPQPLETKQQSPKKEAEAAQHSHVRYLVLYLKQEAAEMNDLHNFLALVTFWWHFSWVQDHSENKIRKRRRVLKANTFQDDEGCIGKKKTENFLHSVIIYYFF